MNTQQMAINIRRWMNEWWHGLDEDRRSSFAHTAPSTKDTETTKRVIYVKHNTSFLKIEISDVEEKEAMKAFRANLVAANVPPFKWPSWIQEYYKENR